MIDFIVNESKCVKCGQCVNDCPVHIIKMNDTFPLIEKEMEEECYRCQHCLAICPTGAISILGKKPENSTPLKDSFPGFEQEAALLKGRRSVRKYKNENIDKKLLSKLLDASLHAPTGINSMDVEFFVVDDKDVMDKIRNKVYDEIEICSKNNSLPAGLEFYKDFLSLWREKEEDNIFRKAPHMLIAAADRNKAHTPLEDSIIALSYFELLAATAGIGTVWCGLAHMAISSVCRDVKKFIGLPEDYDAHYIMMFGKPAIKYFRTTQKETASKIHRISI